MMFLFCILKPLIFKRNNLFFGMCVVNISECLQQIVSLRLWNYHLDSVEVNRQFRKIRATLNNSLGLKYKHRKYRFIYSYTLEHIVAAFLDTGVSKDVTGHLGILL